MRCPLLQTARTNVWPTAVQLHTKLYGSKGELEKTATFIYCRDTRFCRQQEQNKNKPKNKNVCTTAVQLHTRFYGSREEVEKTATFIFHAGLSV